MPAPEQLVTALADRYTIEREIGAGGMATVYLARDVKHDREVALKVLRSDLSAMIGSERFLSEIRIAAKLDHPHILTLIDSGSADGILYYVLPLVRGESLRSKLERERQLGIDEALSITRQVGSALDYAHAQGVVHRDIKPENILLHEGLAVLTDFGIALALKEAGGNRMTETGLSLGTPQYMSPEQATGERALDRRSDLYSLGAVFYEMIAGEPPVTGPTAQVIIAKLLTEKPVKLRVVRSTVTQAMETATEKALAKIPADRHSSAGEFVNALSAITTTDADTRASRRVPIWAATGIAALILIAIASWMALTPRSATSTATVSLRNRTQLTNSGRISASAISDDGKTLAYAVEECGEKGCLYALEIRDIATGSARRLVDGMSGVGSINVSPDRRHILFNGSLGAAFGTHMIPTLGGESKFLLKGQADFRSGGDSLVMIRWGTPADTSWILFSGVDGIPADSVPVTGRVGELTSVTAVPGSDRLVYAFTDEHQEEWVSIDRSGKRHDSRVFRSKNQYANGKATSDALWITTALEQRAPSLLRIPFDAGTGRWAERGDTIETGNAARFNVTRDGGTLVLTEGSTEYALWHLPFADLIKGKLDEPGRLARSTQPIRVALSTDGGSVLLAHPPVTGQRDNRQWVVIPFGGGKETPLPGRYTTARFLDSTTIQLVSEDASGSRFSLMDYRTSAETAVLTVPDTGEVSAKRLPAGGWMWVGYGSDVIRIRMDNAREVRELGRPPWYVFMLQADPLPDGKHIAMLGWKAPGADSLGLSLISVDDGSSRQLWKGFAEFGTFSLQDDGSFIVDVLDGVRAFYRVTFDGRATRLGSAPGSISAVRVSADGRRALVTTVDNRGDAFRSTVMR
jgi:serine/threonine protein kinase